MRSWSIKGINVAYAQFHFPNALNAGMQVTCLMVHGIFQPKMERLLFIPQWYAQPAKIDDKIFQAIIDPHNFFVNNRGMCCSKVMRGMAWE
jgi:hypothetical protein